MKWYLSCLILCIAAVAHAQPASNHRVTTKDIESMVRDYLIDEGAGDNLDVELTGKHSSVLFSYDKPVTIDVDELDYDARAQRWHGEFSFYHETTLVHHLSLAGRYSELISIPVLVDRFHSTDVIREGDIEWTDVPEKRLRQDTVMSASELVGKAPRRVIAAGRPIRQSELQAPIIMYRGDLVQMTYRVHNMDIRTMGEALDDGAMGRLIRVKNLDSGTVVQAVITGPSSVDIRTTHHLRKR